MDPESAREIRKRQRLQAEYEEVGQKATKKFKNSEIDLVQEF